MTNGGGVPASGEAHRRAHIYRNKGLGGRAADVVVGAMGSWRFILVQSAVVAAWIAANVVLLARAAFDPYPFILLNLLFSTQAAYASPLILMASNRAAERDRARDDTEAAEVDQLLTLHRELHAINAQQLEILRILQRQDRPGAG